MSSKKYRKKLKQKYIKQNYITPEPIIYTTDEQKVLDFFKEYPNVWITTTDCMELLDNPYHTKVWVIIKSVQEKNPNIIVKKGKGFKYVI